MVDSEICRCGNRKNESANCQRRTFRSGKLRLRQDNSESQLLCNYKWASVISLFSERFYGNANKHISHPGNRHSNNVVSFVLTSRFPVHILILCLSAITPVAQLYQSHPHVRASRRQGTSNQHSDNSSLALATSLTAIATGASFAHCSIHFITPFPSRTQKRRECFFNNDRGNGTCARRVIFFSSDFKARRHQRRDHYNLSTPTSPHRLLNSFLTVVNLCFGFQAFQSAIFEEHIRGSCSNLPVGVFKQA